MGLSKDYYVECDLTGSAKVEEELVKEEMLKLIRDSFTTPIDPISTVMPATPITPFTTTTTTTGPLTIEASPAPPARTGARLGRCEDRVEMLANTLEGIMGIVEDQKEMIERQQLMINTLQEEAMKHAEILKQLGWDWSTDTLNTSISESGRMHKVTGKTIS